MRDQLKKNGIKFLITGIALMCLISLMKPGCEEGKWYNTSWFVGAVGALVAVAIDFFFDNKAGKLSSGMKQLAWGGGI